MIQLKSKILFPSIHNLPETKIQERLARNWLFWEQKSGNHLLTPTSAQIVHRKHCNENKIKPIEAVMKNIVEHFFKSYFIKPVSAFMEELRFYIQLLRWVLQIKHRLKDSSKQRCWVHLVRALNIAHFWYSIEKNALNIAIGSVRDVLSDIITLNKRVGGIQDFLAIQDRYAIKVCLQFDPTQWRITYEPPAVARGDTLAQKATRQLYREVSFLTFPSLYKNILDLKSLLYDPALLCSPSDSAFLASCTHNLLYI